MLQIKPLIKPLIYPAGKTPNPRAAVSLAIYVAALALAGLCSGAAAADKVAPTLDLNTCQKPSYPAEAAKKGEAGTTELAFLVARDGRITQSKVLKSSGSAQLDQAALTQLATCKVQAGSKNGKPVQSWLKLAYEWKLE